MTNKDLNNESLQIFVPSRNRIYNAELNGNTFQGEGSYSQIQGILTNNSIKFEILGTNDRKYYYSATLSEKLSLEDQKFLAIFLDFEKFPLDMGFHFFENVLYSGGEATELRFRSET